MLEKEVCCEGGSGRLLNMYIHGSSLDSTKTHGVPSSYLLSCAVKSISPKFHLKTKRSHLVLRQCIAISLTTYNACAILMLLGQVAVCFVLLKACVNEVTSLTY